MPKTKQLHRIKVSLTSITWDRDDAGFHDRLPTTWEDVFDAEDTFDAEDMAHDRIFDRFGCHVYTCSTAFTRVKEPNAS